MLNGNKTVLHAPSLSSSSSRGRCPAPSPACSSIRGRSEWRPCWWREEVCRKETTSLWSTHQVADSNCQQNNIHMLIWHWSERSHVSPSVRHAGIDLIAAFYGSLYAGCVPITVRPPHPQNISTTLPTVKMIVEVREFTVLSFLLELLSVLSSILAAYQHKCLFWKTAVKGSKLNYDYYSDVTLTWRYSPSLSAGQSLGLCDDHGGHL